MGIRLTEDVHSGEEMTAEVMQLIEKFERLKRSPAGIHDQAVMFKFWESICGDFELIKREDVDVDEETLERFQKCWDYTAERVKRSGLDTDPII